MKNYTRPVKKRWFKCFIIMILSLGILGFLMNYIVYKKTDKTLMKYFSKEEVDVIKETMYEDGQQVIIDDYTITLERICYDRTGRKGKLMFSVVRDGYNMLEEYTSPSELSARFVFGEDGRFEFFFDIRESGAIISEVEIEKYENIMYIYYDFRASGNIHDTIYLDDSYNNNGEKNPDLASASFQLKESSLPLTCK